MEEIDVKIYDINRGIVHFPTAFLKHFCKNGQTQLKLIKDTKGMWILINKTQYVVSITLENIEFKKITIEPTSPVVVPNFVVLKSETKKM